MGPRATVLRIRISRVSCKRLDLELCICKILYFVQAYDVQDMPTVGKNIDPASESPVDDLDCPGRGGAHRGEVVTNRTQIVAGRGDIAGHLTAAVVLFVIPRVGVLNQG